MNREGRKENEIIKEIVEYWRKRKAVGTFTIFDTQTEWRSSRSLGGDLEFEVSLKGQSREKKDAAPSERSTEIRELHILCGCLDCHAAVEGRTERRTKESRFLFLFFSLSLSLSLSLVSTMPTLPN